MEQIKTLVFVLAGLILVAMPPMPLGWPKCCP